MLLEYNVQELGNALNDFYNVTGVGISILGEDYSPLGAKKANNPYCRMIQSTKRGLVRCLNFNRALLEECKNTKKPCLHICHAGLVEIAVPIIYNDDVIGYAILGHVREAGCSVDFDRTLKEISVDKVLASDIFEALPSYDKEKLKSIMNMASMFGKLMILENFISPKENKNIELIRRYVSENTDKKLSAQEIARAVHISKSSLYGIIHNHYGCTVSEYINKVKIDKAKELLQKTDKSVEDISDMLGFASPAYFGKVFKRSVGTSPLKFRKNYPIDI